MASDPDRLHRLMRLAEQRHGLITVADAAAERVERRTLARLAQRGVLVRHSRGLYRVAGHTPSARDEIRAATVATAGVASHESAVIWWGSDALNTPKAHVTVSHKRSPKARVGFVVHSTTRDLDRVSVTRDGIRVTTPIQTLLDLCAAGHEAATLRSFLAHCLSHRLVSPSQLERFLRRLRKRAPGSRRLRGLANLAGGGVVDSELEMELLSVLEAAGIPKPKVQYRVTHDGRFVARVDAAWPDLYVVIEVDGYRYHSDPRTFVNDRRRQNALANLGYTVLRITADDIRDDPGGLCQTVKATLARATAARAA
ncbi:MAG: type IV toxin-antitoxin system AbiEi family antitoxin domain-containing protein [Acidimicrobiales bacterium]